VCKPDTFIARLLVVWPQEVAKLGRPEAQRFTRKEAARREAEAARGLPPAAAEGGTAQDPQAAAATAAVEEAPPAEVRVACLLADF
jgi:hypothetical protein